MLSTPQHISDRPKLGIEWCVLRHVPRPRSPLVPNPADAHFSHGEVEPRVLLVQKKWLKVFNKDTDVHEATAAKLARAHVRHRCCLSCNNEGFSPARWTLGDGVHLPEKLCCSTRRSCGGRSTCRKKQLLAPFGNAGNF